MSTPANIRVNIGAPFPALVKGGGPVTIAKANGIWTVGFQIANLAGMPLGTDPTTVELLLWNTVSKSFQQTTLAGGAGGREHHPAGGGLAQWRAAYREGLRRRRSGQSADFRSECFRHHRWSGRARCRHQQQLGSHDAQSDHGAGRIRGLVDRMTT